VKLLLDVLAGGGVRRLAGQHAGRHHAVEHIQLALARALEVGGGVVAGRRLDQPGQQRTLFQGEVLGGLSKVAARRKLDPPCSPPDLDRVEIKLENLRLAQRVLHPRGHHHLADLALIGEILPHQQVLDHLLGDG